jgi:rubrerythrin
VRAEEIHAGNHADVIHTLGAEPKAEVEAFPVKSTRENLEAAIKGEVYERDEMYPHFWHQTRAEGNQLAACALELTPITSRPWKTRFAAWKPN